MNRRNQIPNMRLGGNPHPKIVSLARERDRRMSRMQAMSNASGEEEPTEISERPSPDERPVTSGSKTILGIRSDVFALLVIVGLIGVLAIYANATEQALEAGNAKPPHAGGGAVATPPPPPAVANSQATPQQQAVGIQQPIQVVAAQQADASSVGPM